MISIGVDTGGTFTDLVCLEGRGLRVFKLRSTPDDPSRAILEGIAELAGAGEMEVTHGSTVATNAVLERRGARVGMVTTKGFEDVLRIGRQARPELYNFLVRRAEPLVTRDLTFGVAERVGADGSVLEPLRVGELDEIVRRLREGGVESVAVCFLHSYRNPVHEEAVAGRLRAEGFRVSASCEVLPEYREFERWSTTAVNAYVAPLMARYLGRLQEGLGGSRLRVMQSNGGAISARRAGEEAVQTILSGPAAGVIGAKAVGAASGFSRLITFDMGGTSTDVSLIDGVISTTNESLVGDLPVRLPVLHIHTVGAGGGSVAWIDSGGGLRVGPRSAGADPGPVCFGKGEELTVTDANLLLGRLDPAYFLGGRMALDAERTRRVAEAFAARLGLNVVALAEGIVRIANANMERAVRVVSVQRGFDPRDFALLAFGGAGGLHACELAASLEIGTVVVPEHSGVLSALGRLLADVVKDYSASVLQLFGDLRGEMLETMAAPLRERALRELALEGFGAERLVLQIALAMRYKGQAFEIDVPTGEGWDLAGIGAEFHQRHARLYGYSDPGRATEVVQLRLRAVGVTEKPVLGGAEPGARTQIPSGNDKHKGESRRGLPEPDAVREAVFGGEVRETPVWHRGRLRTGDAGVGPAMVISGESTNLIAPGWTWRVDEVGSLVAHSALAGGGAHG